MADRKFAHLHLHTHYSLLDGFNRIPSLVEQTAKLGMNAVAITDHGNLYELQAIAAVIIGGTSLLGGRGSILGTLIGALIMSVLINGLRIMAIQSEWQTVVVGVVVLVAVFADNLRKRRAEGGGRL